jgi:hypothetical protein
MATAPLGLVSPWAALPALGALALFVGLAVRDVLVATPPRGLRDGRLRFRIAVALHQLLQPLARASGRVTARRAAQGEPTVNQPLPVVVGSRRDGVTVLFEDRPRAELADLLIGEVRRKGIRVLPSTGWDDYDARLLASALVVGDLQTSSHPEGFVQLRIRTRIRPVRLGVLVGVGATATLLSEPALALLIAAPSVGETVRGVVRLARLPARILPARRQEPDG